MGKARGSDLRVHYKNTYETCMAIKKMSLRKAQKYLGNVLEHKEAIPFRKFVGGVGRTAQAKNAGSSTDQARWPKKSCNFLLDLLRNAESNAETKGLDTDQLEITHIQVNQATQQRRRTYRAHGRINPYMSCPCHVELVLTESEKALRRPEEAAEDTQKKPKKISKKKLARQRMQYGGQPL